MSEKIIINPVTRISGFMEIEAEMENGLIVDVKTKGMMFRGFEKMLKGRNPFDAVYFTERVCGICSTAHAVASTLALENAMGYVISEQGRYLRDILHGCEFLQNHLRHFYQYTLPDFIKLPEDYPIFYSQHGDYRLPKEKNDKIVKDYFESLDLSRSAHEMLALIGGKAPHNHGVFIGGVTTQVTVDKIIHLKSILHQIENFIEEKMLPDIYQIAEYYPEYYNLGGGYGQFLSYGCYHNYKELGTLYVQSGVYYNNSIHDFDPDNISQEVDYTWNEENPDNKKAYSRIKAPRYQDMAFEVGPLARQWLCGEYKRGISAMDRTIARVLEAKKIVTILNVLIDNLEPGKSVQEEYAVPVAAKGKGLTDTTRGALGHWTVIEDGKISAYQIITPSAWNISSQSIGLRGTAEQALMGTAIKNVSNPVEVGRIVRSFDPCISCATHVYTK